jgi:hypothetical protein
MTEHPAQHHYTTVVRREIAANSRKISLKVTLFDKPLLFTLLTELSKRAGA